MVKHLVFVPVYLSAPYQVIQFGAVKKMVGLAGLEPATSRPPDERATRLRYSPNQARIAGMRPLLQGELRV